MVTEFLLPGIRVVYTDERNIFEKERRAGTCLLTRLDSGLSGADAYVEREADLSELTPDYLTRIYDRHLGRPHALFRLFTAGGEIALRELSGKDYEAFLALSAQSGMGLSELEDPADYERELQSYHQMTPCRQEQERQRFGARILSSYKMLDYGLWLILRNEKPIGLAGLMPGEGGVYLGYLVDKAHRGQGIAAAVCGEIIRYADEELGITSLLAQVHVDNHASKAVLLRLGFSLKMGTSIDATEIWEYRIC